MVCCHMAYYMANLCLNYRTEHSVGFLLLLHSKDYLNWLVPANSGYPLHFLC